MPKCELAHYFHVQTYSSTCSLICRRVPAGRGTAGEESSLARLGRASAVMAAKAPKIEHQAVFAALRRLARF